MLERTRDGRVVFGNVAVDPPPPPVTRGSHILTATYTDTADLINILYMPLSPRTGGTDGSKMTLLFFRVFWTDKNRSQPAASNVPRWLHIHLEASALAINNRIFLSVSIPVWLIQSDWG